MQKRIGSRAAKASLILGRVTRLEKGHRKNSGLNCICEKLCDVESGGEGEKWSQPTEMNPAVAKRGGAAPLPLKLRSKKGRGREGGREGDFGAWRAPRGREGLLGPFESPRNEVCTAALSEVRSRTRSQKMRIDRRCIGCIQHMGLGIGRVISRALRLS